jgi:flagellar basal-body rod modification protein FlgD
MATTTATTGTSGAANAATASTRKRTNDINKLDANDFLMLMLTQMQQQDPLAPTDTNQMIQQVNTIREIAASTGLTSTLDSMRVGQDLTTASSLLGKKVKALSDDGTDVTGVVSKVFVLTDPKNEETRTLRVQIDDKSVKLTNVREVVPV